MKSRRILISIPGLHPHRISNWRPRFGPTFSASLVAGAALLVLGAFQHANAVLFPASPENEFTFSMGAFRVEVTDPYMQRLLNDPSAAPTDFAYPGWTAPYLLSPLLIDCETRISASDVHFRSLTPTYFPVTVGVDLGHTITCRLPNQTLNLTADPVPGYGANPGYPGYAYPSPALLWTAFTNREILTEIQAFTLRAASDCKSNNSPLLAPTGSLLDKDILKGGYDNGITPRSLGQVQRLPAALAGHDYPARSFFNVYVQVTLPLVPNTMSASVFPPSGAVLYNDLPMIIENPNLPDVDPALPSPVIYTNSGITMAVPLKFLTTCPNINPTTGFPYYSADDTFGSIVLAGHDTTGISPCTGMPTHLDTFLQTVFGTPLKSKPSAPIGYPFQTNLFLANTSSLDQTKGTNLNGQSLDSVNFTNTIRLSELSLSGFVNPVSLPGVGTSKTYTNVNTAATMKFSFDGSNFISGVATGAVRIVINNNTNVDPVVGNTSIYQTELLSMSLAGNAFFGPFLLRESPILQSPGKHIVQPRSGGGFTIASFIDANLELSVNGGVTYTPADTSTRLKLADHGCGVSSGQLWVIESGSSIILSWNDPTYRLQGTPSLTPAVWSDIAGTSPVTNSLSGTSRFYRIICP